MCKESCDCLWLLIPLHVLCLKHFARKSVRAQHRKRGRVFPLVSRDLVSDKERQFQNQADYENENDVTFIQSQQNLRVLYIFLDTSFIFSFTFQTLAHEQHMPSPTPRGNGAIASYTQCNVSFTRPHSLFYLLPSVISLLFLLLLLLFLLLPFRDPCSFYQTCSLSSLNFFKA